MSGAFETSVFSYRKIYSSINSSAAKESEGFDSTGAHRIEQELHQVVLKVVKEHTDSMIEENDLQPPITEKDVVKYLDMVIKEIKRERPKS